MNPAWDPPGQFGASSARPNLAQYYQGYRDVAAQRGLLLIDHYISWVQIQNTNPNLFEQYVPDGVHPTAEALQQVVTPQIIASLTAPEPTSATLILVLVVPTILQYRNRRPRECQ